MLAIRSASRASLGDNRIDSLLRISSVTLLHLRLDILGFHYLSQQTFILLLAEITLFAKIIERSRAVSKKLNGGIAGLMKKNKIEVINGNL